MSFLEKKWVRLILYVLFFGGLVVMFYLFGHEETFPGAPLEGADTSDPFTDYFIACIGTSMQVNTLAALGMLLFAIAFDVMADVDFVLLGILRILLFIVGAGGILFSGVGTFSSALQGEAFMGIYSPWWIGLALCGLLSGVISFMLYGFDFSDGFMPFIPLISFGAGFGICGGLACIETPFFTVWAPVILSVLLIIIGIKMMAGNASLSKASASSGSSSRGSSNSYSGNSGNSTSKMTDSNNRYLYDIVTCSSSITGRATNGVSFKAYYNPHLSRSGDNWTVTVDIAIAPTFLEDKDSFNDDLQTVATEAAEKVMSHYDGKISDYERKYYMGVNLSIKVGNLRLK